MQRIGNLATRSKVENNCDVHACPNTRPRPASRDEGQKRLEPAKEMAGVPLTVLRLVLPTQSGGRAQDPAVNLHLSCLDIRRAFIINAA